MQHDHVLKVEFWPIDPIPRVQGVCGQNICYHVAAFFILFNLISNMTMYWKNWFFTYWSLRQGRGVGGGGGSACKIFATTLLHSWFSLILICNMTMFWKSWILTYWPHPQGRGEGVGISGQIFAALLLHFLSPFKLIFNVTMFWKK